MWTPPEKVGRILNIFIVFMQGTVPNNLVSLIQLRNQSQIGVPVAYVYYLSRPNL